VPLATENPQVVVSQKERRGEEADCRWSEESDFDASIRKGAARLRRRGAGKFGVVQKEWMLSHVKRPWEAGERLTLESRAQTRFPGRRDSEAKGVEGGQVGSERGGGEAGSELGISVDFTIDATSGRKASQKTREWEMGAWSWDGTWDGTGTVEAARNKGRRLTNRARETLEGQPGRARQQHQHPRPAGAIRQRSIYRACQVESTAQKTPLTERWSSRRRGRWGWREGARCLSSGSTALPTARSRRSDLPAVPKRPGPASGRIKIANFTLIKRGSVPGYQWGHASTYIQS